MEHMQMDGLRCLQMCTIITLSYRTYNQTSAMDNLNGNLKHFYSKITSKSNLVICIAPYYGKHH